MSRRTSLFLIACASAALTIAPAQATTINLRAIVPTICQMQYSLTGDAAATQAELVVFCNAPAGARLSGVILGGDGNGYRVSHQGDSFVTTPGAEFDISNYASAFAGREYLQIEQVSGSEPVAPTIVFELTPEG